jgi:UDP:flavonoid glycosyltransferase YjiC (YdhE family)
VLVTLGSLGDLHPFIALGRALAARGADVSVACSAEYQGKVERADLKFHAVRPSFEDMQRQTGMEPAELTRSLLERGEFLFRALVVPSVRRSYEDMLPLVAGADMVLTSSLCIGARLACERSEVPWIAIVLQPLMFLSAYDPPVIPKAEWLGPVLRRLGVAATGFVFGLLKRGVGTLLGPVRALRRDIGLPPSRRNPLFEGQFGPMGAIALYSKILGDRCPDYPEPTSIVGFAWFDSQDGAPPLLEPELLEFLAAGAAPLVFTLGSLIVHSPGAFYTESVAAARLLGQRAVLLVGESAPPEVTGLRSPDVYVAAYAPHSLLFPRALVIAHQGGIGTLAQALRSGRPQLVVPFFGDQLDNAARAVRLGVARTLPPRRYAAPAAAREFLLLTTQESYGAHARTVRDVLLREDGAVEAADVVLNRLNSAHRTEGEVT